MGSNIFTGTSASIVLAPTITGSSAGGQISFGTANIPPVLVAAGDSLIMVFHVLEIGVAIACYASAGINIVKTKSISSNNSKVLTFFRWIFFYRWRGFKLERSMEFGSNILAIVRKIFKHQFFFDLGLFY